MGIEVIINNLPTLLATLLIIVGLFFILVSKAKITGKINFIVTERNSKTVFDVGIVVFAIGLIIGLSSIPLFNVDKSSGSFLLNNQPTEGNNQPTKLQAAFVANRTSGSAPLLVMFTDQSIGTPSSYLWNFGDNISSKHFFTANHTFTNPGIYNVSLTVTNAGGSSTMTITNYITAN